VRVVPAQPFHGAEAEELLGRSIAPYVACVAARRESEGTERVTGAQQSGDAVVAEVRESDLALGTGEQAVADPEGAGPEGVLDTRLGGHQRSGVDAGERLELLAGAEEEAVGVDLD